MPRRKKVYLGAMLQRRMVARLATFWCAYHLVLFHSMFLMRYLEYQLAVRNGSAPSSFVSLYLGFAGENLSLLICAAAITPILVWDVVQVTHRVSGPLVRLEKTLLRMAAGETVHELKFRPTDWVASLERAFNDYLASLERRTAVGASSRESVPAAKGTTDQADSPSDQRGCGQADSAGEFAGLLDDLEDLSKLVAPQSPVKAKELQGGDRFSTDQPRL